MFENKQFCTSLLGKTISIPINDAVHNTDGRYCFIYMALQKYSTHRSHKILKKSVTFHYDDFLELSWVIKKKMPTQQVCDFIHK